jgi:hypothetical protein
MDTLVVAVAVAVWLLLLIPAAFAFSVRDVGCSPPDRIPPARARPSTPRRFEPEPRPS